MTQTKGDNWVRLFEISDPRKHKNGFTIYKVTSVVFPKNAPEAASNIVVWKRFNDFKKLHSNLESYMKHCNISEDLPKFSRRNYFKRFEDEIIQERIKCALDLLNFIGRHSQLFTCGPFLQFFNNGYQISDSISNCDIKSISNDNGNVSDSSSDVLNVNFVEKSHINGVAKKDYVEIDKNNVNEDLFLSASSEDESICVSEGTESYSTPKNVSPRHSSNSPGDGKKNWNQLIGRDDSEITSKKPSLDQETNSTMAKSLTSLPDHFDKVEEIVTCYPEKPIKDSEMWVWVHTNDHRSKSHSGLNEESPTGAVYANDDYLVEAAYHIGQAQNYEVGGEYEAAFAFYKAAVACLLTGIPKDEIKERRQAVEEKIKRYAERAESVYLMHMSKKKEEEKEEVVSCTEGLKAYKVLSIIDKVILVEDIVETGRYVIKVLEKSPCPIDLKKKTIIPYNVPYMVKLVKYFENENSIFLVLQYACGGKLWDHVDRCFQAHRQPHVKISRENESIGDLREHTGRRSIDDDKSEKSYFEMLKDYTTYTAKKMFGYYEENPNVEDKPEMSPAVIAEEEENSEVKSLVRNSQKLLESIKNTMEQSEFVTNSLTNDLEGLESVIDMKGEWTESENVNRKNLLGLGRKKRSKSVARSRFERRFSSEDVLESKSRTASNSLDRSGQWSRLAAMLESAPTLSESTIRDWAAEMFVALETLHRWGVTCRDLHPGNILLDEKGHLLLTFQLYWRGVDSSISEDSIRGLYAAPETTKIFPITPAADWWSFGALLFQLLTGKSLASCYPGGIFGHTILTFPEFLSPEACSLLTELLRYEPTERLGGGINGSDDIKYHPFFSKTDWHLVYGG